LGFQGLIEGLLKDYDLELSNKGLQDRIAHPGYSIDSPIMKEKYQGMKDQGDRDQLHL
jgi:hypothetical protein